MSDLISVTVAGGKYTIRQTSTSEWECLRYGEPWPAFEGQQPDNLHTALAYAIAAKDAEIEALRSELTKAKAAIHEIRIEAFQREPVPTGADAVKYAIRGAALALSGRLGSIERMCRAALKGDAQDPHAAAKAYLAGRPDRAPTQTEIDDDESCGGFV